MHKNLITQIIGLVIEIILTSGLIIFFISSLVSSFYGSPYVPMTRKKVKSLFLFGALSQNDIFFDLGCGDSRTLITAARDFNVKKAVGYDISLFPYLKSLFSILISRTGKKVTVHRSNFLKADISSATFIYLYLFPKIVDKLAYKLERETNVGTKILSASFPINLNGHPRIKLIKSEKFDKITAYLYEKI